MALLVWAAAAQAAGLTVRILPHDFVVPAGASQPLTLDVRDASGTAVTGSVQWSVRPPTAGRIGANNVFIAGTTDGEAVIRATVIGAGVNGTAWAHVRIGDTVTRRTPRALVVTPRQIRVPVSGVQSFSAEALGGGVPSGTVTWRVIPPSAGHIDAAGQFVAGAVPAQCQVVAVARDAADKPAGLGVAHVSIVDGGGTSTPQAGIGDVALRVLPARALLTAGDSRTFSVTLPPAARGTTSVTWSVQPPTLGTIASDGTFTASPEANGAGVVMATVTGPNGRIKRAVGAVQVVQQGALRLTLTPREAKLAAGQSSEFHITGLPAAATTRARIAWRVMPENAGTISGTGDVGIFTAGRQRGRAQIEARVSDPQGRSRTLVASVTIVDPSRQTDVAPQISVEGPATGRMGAPSVFHVQSTGASAGDFTGATVDWSVSPATAGTLRTQPGRKAYVSFTPSQAGPAMVTATVSFDGITRTASRQIEVSR